VDLDGVLADEPADEPTVSVHGAGDDAPLTLAETAELHEVLTTVLAVLGST
jgi:hypothetical protein